MVPRLVDSLVQGVDDHLVLHHDLRWSLKVSKSKSDQVVFLDACQLCDYAQHCHLRHNMLLLVFVMEYFQEHSQKIELSKELVHGHTHGLKRVDCIVVLDELIMRSTHPGKTKNTSEGWVYQHRQHVHDNLVNRSDLSTLALDHLAEQSNDILVNQFTIQALRSDW